MFTTDASRSTVEKYSYGSYNFEIDTSNAFKSPDATALDKLKNIMQEVENLTTAGASHQQIAKKLSEARKMLKGGNAVKVLKDWENDVYSKGERAKEGLKATGRFAKKTGKVVAKPFVVAGKGIAKGAVAGYNASADYGSQERRHLNFTVPQLDAGIKSLEAAISTCSDDRLMQRLQTQQRKYINAKHYINTHYQKAFDTVMKTAEKQGLVSISGGKYLDAEGKEITIQEYARFKNIITVNMIKGRTPDYTSKMESFKNALTGIGKVLGTGRDFINDHRKLVAGTGIAIASALTISNFMDYTVGDQTVGSVVKKAITDWFNQNPKFKAALNVLAITGLVMGVAAVAEKTSNARNRAAQRRRTMDSIQADIDQSQEEADKAAKAQTPVTNSLESQLDNKAKLTPEQIEQIADDPALRDHLVELSKGKPAPVKPSVQAYAIRTLAEVDKKIAEFKSASAEVKAQKNAAQAAARQQKNIETAIDAFIGGKDKTWEQVGSNANPTNKDFRDLCRLIDNRYVTGTLTEEQKKINAEIESGARSRIQQTINTNMQQRSNS